MILLTLTLRRNFNVKTVSITDSDSHCQKLLAQMTMVRQRAIQLGSDCTGLGTDALAARELGLNFKVVFGSGLNVSVAS